MSPLASLPPLLRAEPALTRVLGRASTVLAVPEAGRAVTVAALAHLSERRPLLVATATGTAAERLADDLGAFVGGRAGDYSDVGPAGDYSDVGPAGDYSDVGPVGDYSDGGPAHPRPDVGAAHARPGADAVELFPAWETLPFERVSPSVDTMGRRLRVLWRLADPDPAHRPRIVVASVRALLQRLGPDTDRIEPLIVRPGDRLDPHEVVARLVAAGYRREDLVEHRGEVALRGSIVDVFPSTADVPVRIDLWGDEVDRLTEFSVSDQRSTTALAHTAIFPARELVPTDDMRKRAAALVGEQPWGREQWERLAEGLTFDGMESWLPWLVDGQELLTDRLPAGAQVVLAEPRRMRDRAADVAAEEADLAAALARTWGAVEGDEHHGFPALHLPFDRLLAGTDAPVLTLANAPESPETPAIDAGAWAPVVGDGSALVSRLSGLLRDGYRVVVAADGTGSAGRLAQILREHGIDLPIVTPSDAADLTSAGGRIAVAPLHTGFILNQSKLAVLTEADLTGRRRAHRQARARRREAIGAFEDLKPGDYIVHYTHGVGRYGGMVTRSIGGIERDYLLLEYKGGDRLYVPSDQIDAIRHYIGGETPTLHRLGGSDFAKTKSRVRAAVREVAQELVVLYQRRVNSPGHAFAPDTPWQMEMEAAFPYVETPDQIVAINDVKADMEADRPMDRLVCGDVGFGKTEVAIRAAFKAIQDGKQVAVLVPTTLLAGQHHQTFADRFAGYPIRVEVLSRFLTPAQAKKVIDGLASGEVDCVIGTHRLLQDNVKFKDLGLLVVDEEQRFGVQHKEQMKKLKANVDVLTMTATPIPRTLEMSLTGIRDLTLLNTPPADRQPILTYVGELDERAIAEAMRRELLREGQVFFVHNRVADIEHVAADLRQFVPEARIAVAHGQMDEGTLERVVLDFWQGDYDVLVCTTIIESGIDMPTVNTLVVDRADRLGLGQLHQLRGRVGRSGQRAYAYLFHPPDVALSEEAYERLRTIGEATELGSGFKIAMRDLEIRGAGNLLGESQSGHIAAVGYDLYCQMVNEAVAEMKGEEVREPAEVKLDLPVDAHLPAAYVPKEELRLEAYRRLAAVTTAAEVDDIRAEWEDRYGPVPPPGAALLAVARLRAEGHRVGLREVAVVSGTARMAPLQLKTSEELRLRRLNRRAVYKKDLGQLVVPIDRAALADPAGYLVGLLAELIPAA